MDIHGLLQTSFESAVAAYTLALVCHLFSRKALAPACLALGLCLNSASLVLRYWTVFPLIPLFQEPFFLPFAVGVAGGLPYAAKRNRPVFLWLVAGLAWAAYLFPSDFYLPHLQFKTPFAHGLFLFGVAGKALFLLAGEAGLALLARRKP